MKKKTAVKFSDRLKFLRNDLLHKKQQEMADLVAVSHSTYSKLETGILAPSQKMLEKLSRILGISILWLRDGTGKPPLALRPELIMQRNCGMAGGGREISDEDLERIIELAGDEKLRNLAGDIAKTTTASPEDALAELICEAMKTRPDDHRPDETAR